METPTLDIKKSLEEIRATYDTSRAVDTLNAMVLGPIGSGKTMLLTTCPRPIVIDCFDPGGMKSIRGDIEKGGIYPTLYEADDRRKPYAYTNWEGTLRQRVKEGFFDHIGTYCIDSFTSWVPCLMSQIVYRQSLKPKKERDEFLPAIQDYLIGLMTIRDVIKYIANLPCHFIMTGHMAKEKDELKGTVFDIFKASPSLQIEVPLLFDEVYITHIDASGVMNKYEMYTGKRGTNEAKTRIGGKGLFKLSEPQDIKNLLKKAGLPYEDKEVE